MTRYLTNNNFKYWFRYYKDTARPYAIGFCVYKDGTYINYINPGWDRNKRQINSNPVQSKPIWKFIDDTTMMFGEGEKYRIVVLNADSLILQDEILPDRYLKLHRDNDQDTKPQW